MIFVREYFNGEIISSGNNIGVGGIGDIGYWWLLLKE